MTGLSGEPPDKDAGWGRSLANGVGGIIAAVVTAVLIAVLVPWVTGGGTAADRLDETPTTSTAPPLPPPATAAPEGGSRQPAKLYANRDSGPAGTKVRLSGTGFGSGEDITLRFHTDVVGHTQADDQGAFADVSVRVPSDWQFEGQFTFKASGDSTLAWAEREFRVT